MEAPESDAGKNDVLVKSIAKRKSVYVNSASIRILLMTGRAGYLPHPEVVGYTAACRNPTQEWTTQQLRNATMDGDAPKILLRDRDDKFGASFDRVAKGVGIRVIKTAVRAPDMNAIAERFVGSAQREILDHVIVLDDQHLGRLVAPSTRSTSTWHDPIRGLASGSRASRRSPSTSQSASSPSPCLEGFTTTTGEPRDHWHLPADELGSHPVPIFFAWKPEPQQRRR